MALTRAKKHLNIHTNSGFLDNLKDGQIENFERIFDNNQFHSPEELIIHLTHRDVWLDFFWDKQGAVAQLTSGDFLLVNGQGCAPEGGNDVLKFSQQFLGQLAELGRHQYYPTRARVNYVVYWLKEGAKEEIRIVLPEICLKKMAKN